MPSELQAALPVYVLTGFLGSGKTTVLNALLKSPRMADALVIINELGEIAIDHLLVREAREELLVLESGCVCCTLRSDLLEQLSKLLDERDQGKVTRFSRVVLETTGLADPAPIVQTLLKHPALQDRLYVAGIVCTVDGQLALSTLGQHAEAEKQICVADKLLITKLDLVDAATREALVRKLSELNPDAPQLPTQRGALDVQQFLDVAHLDTRSIVYQLPTRQAHTSDVQRFALQLDGELDFRSFSLWVAMLTQLWGSRVLRLKAVISARGEPHPIAVQAVQHVVYPPLDLPRSAELVNRSFVVVLARGLDAGERRELEASLRALNGA